MTKLRKCIVAAMATTILAGSALTSQDRAWAGSFNSEMPAMGRAHGHEGGGFRHHGGGGGWGRFGTGLAVGLGVELLGQAIAHPDQALEYEHKQIHRAAKRQAGRQMTNDTVLRIRKFQKLLDDANAINKRMSPDLQKLQKHDIDNRQEDVNRAKKHCLGR